MLRSAGDCTDGAGMRPRCDLLRKDSGKDVQLSWDRCSRGSALPDVCGGLTSYGLFVTEVEVVLTDYLLCR